MTTTLVKVRLMGTTPLLMNRMPEDVLAHLIGGTKPEKKKRTPKEIAAQKIYRDDRGRIGLPIEHIYGAIRAAGRNVRIGRKQISRKNTSRLHSLVSIKEKFLPLSNGKQGKVPKWKVRSTNLVGHSQGKVKNIQPQFDKWSLDFTIAVDVDSVPLNTIKRLFERAGVLQGLGMYRPAWNGGYGCFKVEQFEPISVDSAP